MACARIKLSKAMTALLRSEMETAITQSNLGREDTAIAKLYLLDRIPQIEIAVEYGYDRSTISRRIKAIVSAVELSAKKLRLV